MRAERGGRPVEGARLFKAMRFNGDAAQASEHVGFVSGRLSPLAQKEFTKRGWQLVESVTIAAER